MLNSESRLQTNQKSIEIIAFDKDHNLQYEGLCKLRVNVPSKLLLIEPLNEEFKLKSALFQWKFLMEKNILFIFGDHDFQDIALIFNSVERCKKAFEAIHKNKPKDLVPKTMLYERFLNPISHKIAAENCTLSLKFKITVKKWLKKFTVKEKEGFVKFLKDTNIYDLIFLNDSRETDVSTNDSINDNNNQKYPNSRKRKHQDIAKVNNNVEKSTINKTSKANDKNFKNNQQLETDHSKYTKIIERPNFKLINTCTSDKQRRGLLILTEKDKCFEYPWIYKKQIYGCRDCRSKKLKQHTAILEFDENGNFVVKMEERDHECADIKYIPENYNEIKIIKKPDYQLLENCAGRKSTVLIIFDQNDKNQCYEYVWDFKSKRYCCRGCPSKQIKANLFNESTKDEYVEIENDNHTCVIRKYDPEKYTRLYQFVLRPNFEIIMKRKGNGKRKTLIIFDSNNRNLCYYFFYDKNQDYFVCCGCWAQNKRITAKLNQNDEGEEYVVLSTKKHTCELRPYKEAEQILRPPDIEFFETNLTASPRLLVYDSKDKNLCYTFGFASGTNKSNKYCCLGCLGVTRKNEKKAIAACNLIKVAGDNYYIRMTNQSHCCKPRNYETEKQKLVATNKTFDFFLFRQKSNPSVLKAAIIHPKNKNQCYRLSYCKNTKQIFKCGACNNKNKSSVFSLYQDENGKEYFDHDFKRHVCKPQQISKIKDSEIEKLENSGLHKESRRNPIIDEDRLIKEPNFELSANKAGVSDARLIIFHPKDKAFCYEFYYTNSAKHYVCCKCVPMNKYITAKLQVNEKGQKCILLGKNEHVCEAIQYSTIQKIIVEAPNFMKFEEPNKPKKLIIFTSSNKEMCYEYTFMKESKHLQYFRCHGCYVLSRKSLYAKIYEKQSGEEYVHLLKNDHVCVPQKFVKEKFQPKILDSSKFVLHCNDDGEENKRLIVFSSESRDLMYEYSRQKNSNIYSCNFCLRKKRVPAKLFENESGQKFIELSPTEHVCTPQIYDPSKYGKREKLYSNFFILHHVDGAPKKKLVILDSENTDFGYEYYCYKQTPCYYCCGCKIVKKDVTAKLFVDENGKEFLELNKQKHVCEIRNLRESGLIFYENEFKLQESQNSKEIILQHSSKKNGYHKFAYDASLDAFCCVTCKKTKNLYITATICSIKDDKKFLLLNRKNYCALF